MPPFKSHQLRQLAPLLRRPKTTQINHDRPVRPVQFHTSSIPRAPHVSAITRRHDASTEHETHGSAEEIETVSVRKRPWNWKRLGLFSSYLVISYMMVNYILSPLDKVAAQMDTEEENEPEVDEEGNVISDEDDEDAIFIPFQFPKKLPRKFYKESDPDWQEFVRISNDEDKKNAIREELALRTLSDIQKNPQIARALGADIKLHLYWLDLQYPDSPPPEYVRSGIEITDDFIAWSQQTIPHSYYVQLSHILYPRALFAAAYNSLKIFSHLQLVKLKGNLGFELNTKDKQIIAISRVERARVKMEAQKAKSDAMQDANNAEKADIESQLQQKSASASPTSAESTKQSAAGSPASQRSDLLGSYVTPALDAYPSTLSLLPRSSPDLSIAWKVFATTLIANWNRTRMDMRPPGAFFVFGQVEVIGSKARAKCDVHAAYDPRQAKFVLNVVKVKHFWSLVQSAKGGP